MKNYKIEGNIDFFSELYKSLDVEDDDFTNLCLITNQLLIDKYVELQCGHKFNYLPLYNDIKNHKQKFNGMEGSSGKLAQGEIRCPYCRKKHNGVLPYYAELNLGKVNGVNNIDPNYKPPSNSFSHHYKKCEFLTLNAHFDPSGNEAEETNDHNKGNCKFLKCFHIGTQINFFHGEILDGDNYGDEKHYCWNHKKQMVKKYKKDILDKAKAEVKQAKLKEKEEAKIKATEEKLKIKEEKMKEKEEQKKVQKKEKKEQKNEEKVKEEILENVVLGPINITTGCLSILKSGPNKGSHCGSKIVSENNLCKRHENNK